MRLLLLFALLSLAAAAAPNHKAARAEMQRASLPPQVQLQLNNLVLFPEAREAMRIERGSDGRVRFADDPQSLEQLLDVSRLRAFSNIFLGNLDYGEPPGGFSASDLADFDTADRDWMPALFEAIRWEEETPP